MRFRYTKTVFLGGFMSVACGHAYEAAYTPTPRGQVLVRQLPPATVLVTRVEAPYFAHANQLFRRLFAYIQRHGIAMTVPVEARMNPAEMWFYVSQADIGKCVTNDALVQVVSVPQRHVVALGARGGYTAANFAETAQALQAWLAAHPAYRTNGAPYGVYWHGPFRLWFLKHYEVHIPIEAPGP
ncbi:MAG: heme-binding protein [bacterium]|nr:heme-binding protein [bacterium]